MCNYAAMIPIKLSMTQQNAKLEQPKHTSERYIPWARLVDHLLEGLNGVELLQQASPGIHHFGSERLPFAGHILGFRCQTTMGRHDKKNSEWPLDQSQFPAKQSISNRRANSIVAKYQRVRQCCGDGQYMGCSDWGQVRKGISACAWRLPLGTLPSHGSVAPWPTIRQHKILDDRKVTIIKACN